MSSITRDHQTCRPDLLMIRQAGYFSPVPRIYNLFLGISLEDDVAVVSVSTLERVGQQETREVNKSFSTTLRPNVETPFGMQEPSSTYQFHPHAGSITAWNWAGGSAKSVQSLGFPSLKVQLQRNAVLWFIAAMHPVQRSSEAQQLYDQQRRAHSPF